MSATKRCASSSVSHQPGLPAGQLGRQISRFPADTPTGVLRRVERLGVGRQACLLACQQREPRCLPAGWCAAGDSLPEAVPIAVACNCGTPAAATFVGMEDHDRAEVALTASERDQLESFLHDGRVEVVALLDGLTEEQARRRLVPSLTTLLGLVKHAPSSSGCASTLRSRAAHELRSVSPTPTRRLLNWWRTTPCSP